ncbi:MAG: hypothetical protein D6785_15630 [Planctomycetota bacterium]|nr:MAG: hypothetical protein D6785_15630 [Planctomycetota bacterium]
MSTLAKAFVVIVFMFGIIQTSIYSTIFYHRKNWRKNYEDLKNDYIRLARHKNNMIALREQRIKVLQKAISDYRQEVIAYKSSLSSEAHVNTVLKTSLAQKVQEYEILSQDYSQIAGQIKTLNDTIQTLRGRIKDLEDKLANSQNNEKLAQQQVNRLIQIKTDLESDLDELKKSYLEVRKAQEALQLKIDALREAGYPVDEVLVADLAPPIKCEVVAVIKNIEPNLVLLSAGENQKVKKGYKFTIYRGNEFIARVVVEKVLPKFAGARVEFKKGDIQVGDGAATHLE